MPSAHEIQRGISRSHVTDVDDASQAPVGDKHIAGNQVTVSHHVAGAARQDPHDGAGASEPGNIQQRFAVPEAGLHPRVVGW
jgi:hypothetical protein